MCCSHLVLRLGSGDGWKRGLSVVPWRGWVPGDRFARFVAMALARHACSSWRPAGEQPLMVIRVWLAQPHCLMRRISPWALCFCCSLRRVDYLASYWVIYGIYWNSHINIIGLVSSACIHFIDIYIHHHHALIAATWFDLRACFASVILTNADVF